MKKKSKASLFIQRQKLRPAQFESFAGYINPFPNDKILDQTKLKAFADDKLNVTKIRACLGLQTTRVSLEKGNVTKIRAYLGLQTTRACLEKG